jgi:ATP-dependent DNA helicase RecG
MRPEILAPLFGRVAALPGVGPKTAPLFDRLLARVGAQARVVDLLFHLPTNVIDRSQRPTIAEAPLDAQVVVQARVVEHRRPQGRYAKQPYRVLVEDDTGDIELIFFLANPDWIERSLPVGATRWISGRIELYDGRRQMVHPDRVLDEAGLAKLPPFEAIYGLTEGLQARFVLRATEEALTRIPTLPEWRRTGCRPLLTRCAPRIGPTARKPCRRSIPRASVSPSTNCWRRNWRCASRARKCVACPGAITKATAAFPK